MLLMLREEIVCIVILVFMIYYYAINKIKDKEMFFLKISCVALVHVVLDLVTLITVNHLEQVPDIVNRILHVCFYITGILFAIWTYSYFVRHYARSTYAQILIKSGYIFLVIYVIMLAFLPMEYLEGRGTNYSYGLLAISGYAIFLLYSTACVIFFVMARKQLDRRVKLALVPLFVFMYAAVILQAVIPELLMTGGNLTLVCIGLFAALDNPDKDLTKQALWDFTTGLKNRTSYDRELAMYTCDAKTKQLAIGFVVADMNFLKLINDNYGHAEGDRFLEYAATALRDHLRSAVGIYRLGGDEFAAIYLSAEDKVVQAEMEAVTRACAELTERAGLPVPLHLAMGYAPGQAGEDPALAFKEADRNMYEHKQQIKAQHPQLTPFR